jgi:hypothetical protein
MLLGCPDGHHRDRATLRKGTQLDPVVLVEEQAFAALGHPLPLLVNMRYQIL